jgi:hypothetical protein
MCQTPNLSCNHFLLQVMASAFQITSIALLVIFLLISFLVISLRFNTFPQHRENETVTNWLKENAVKSSFRKELQNNSLPRPIPFNQVINQTILSPPVHDFQSELAHVLSCKNQTVCFPPKLQLRRPFNVYFCKHTDYGIRFYFLVKESLLLHPKIHLVNTPQEADYIVYLPESSSWRKTECSSEDPSKMIVLDESDYPNLFESPDRKTKFFMTFKRSYVKRQDGVFKHFMHYLPQPNVFPMTYPMAEIYIRPRYKPYQERSMEILCSLRALPADPTRTRVKKWIDEYLSLNPLIANRSASGQVNQASRPVISKQYFEKMYSTKIIVTSNPSNWEGDFRFCEAIASGALIFVDDMFVPRVNPFLHGKHIIYYNNHNKTDLFEKLDFYRNHFEESKKIALRGYLHAMKYHRAANLIDYVFRTVHTYLLAEKDPNRNTMVELLSNETVAENYQSYQETGYQLRLQAMAMQRRLKEQQQEASNNMKNNINNNHNIHPI